MLWLWGVFVGPQSPGAGLFCVGRLCECGGGTASVCCMRLAASSRSLSSCCCGAGLLLGGVGVGAWPMLRPSCSCAARAGDGVCRGWVGCDCGSRSGWFSRRRRLSTNAGGGSCWPLAADVVCAPGLELLLNMMWYFMRGAGGGVVVCLGVWLQLWRRGCGCSGGSFGSSELLAE